MPISNPALSYILPAALVGDVLLVSSDGDKPMSANVYTKAKSIRIHREGALRIKFTVIYTGGSASAGSDARIYRNGVAVGTEQHGIWGSDTEFSEDISGWWQNDTVELWLNVEAACTVTAKLFRIYLDNPEEGRVVMA